MKVVRDLLSSKKFVAALVAIAVWLGGYVGLDLDPMQVAPIIGVIVAYILGQGFADHGKEAEKLRQSDPERPPENRRPS